MTVSAFLSAPPAPAASPLTTAYARITEALPALRISEEGPHSGGGWVQGSELARGGAALDTYLALDEERVLREYGARDLPHVVAGFGLHRYAWPVCLLFTLPHFLLRRVPRIGPADVSFHPELGRLTVRTGRFSCLPDDPAAALPGAEVVPEEEALRTAVRSAAAEHLGPVLAAFGPRMRRGRRALWGTATDELAEGLWYVGRLLGEEERASREAERLLPGSTAPYAGGAGFRELADPCGERLLTRDRVSCCLFYTLRPEDTCVTCPRTSDTSRLARLRDCRS
ncbi:(2Fe-2S)-binding protein [Streptomyces sp. ACA25]|uniref:(2Fe-2S)-binding protein n=1 Tax=Streptomyces sp. ACA25 TaxID=3022596 RepID=UPI002307FBA5|nr:(2Fe-2S)-binding protein [Streptomyces sp. ACA25]MDB1089205.1 (2Fe-2S)-binding protein [Streptomyces sp. ACA25]